MTHTPNLAQQTGQLAVRIRDLRALDPRLQFVALRGQGVLHDVWTADSLLSILDHVNAQGAEPDQYHVDPERQKIADDISEKAGIKTPPRFADLIVDEFAVERPFLTALEAFAEALKAHRKLLTKVTAEAVALARQGVIEAHLAGAQMRAAGLAEAMQAWNAAPELTLQPGESIPLERPEALAEQLYTAFFTMTIDDVSKPGTPERARFMERLRILDEVMGALKGRVG